MLGMVIYVCNSSPGEVERGRFMDSLTRQPSDFLASEPASKMNTILIFKDGGAEALCG